MPLSDMAARQAKATGRNYTIPDFDGLALGVTGQGGRSWLFRYYWAGKQKRMSFGLYPEVRLLDARRLRDDARTMLARGANPHVHRKHKRAEVRLADENTFEVVYTKWLAHRSLTLKEGRQTSLSLIPRIFKKDVRSGGRGGAPSVERTCPAQHYLFRHDIDPKKRMSENTLNAALKRLGYRDLLTGHGIRGTLSTALNKIGYPKVWTMRSFRTSIPIRSAPPITTPNTLNSAAA